MKFKGVTPHFRCAMADKPGHVCSDERARWPEKGYWADVCQAAMDVFLSNLNRKERDPWTGRKKGT